MNSPDAVPAAPDNAPATASAHIVPKPVEQKRIALDTNIMHAMHLYLGLVEKFGLTPLGPNGDDPAEVIKREYLPGETRNSLLFGLKGLAYLRDQCASGAVVRYSPITMLEMTGGLLRGQGLLNAAQDGLPPRIWSKVDEREISMRLAEPDYKKVETSLASFVPNLNVAGVDISEVEPEHLREIWVMARFILGHVFIDIGDCLVYTTAVLDECDELLSRDGYFRSVVNLIHNPGGSRDPDVMAHFTAVKKHLLITLQKVTGIDPFNPELPIKLPFAPQIIAPTQE